MKTMTCRQLGGACDLKLQAGTFDEIAMLVSKHAREQVAQGDAAHIEAMNAMRAGMASPTAAQAWLEEKRNVFNALPEDTV